MSQGEQCSQVGLEDRKRGAGVWAVRVGFLEEVTSAQGQGYCSVQLLTFLKSGEWKHLQRGP